MSIQLKPIIAALGLALATLSGSAAAITLYPETQFEDDDVDFLVKGAGNTDLDTLEVGDTLVSILEIGQTVEIGGTGSDLVAPGELTGIAAIQLHAIDMSGNLIFKPHAAGLNSILALTSGTAKVVAEGGMGEGAMVALWLDDDEDLTVTGSTNCTGLDNCIDLADDDVLFEVDGFTGNADGTEPDGWNHTDEDEFWIAFGASTAIDQVLAGSSTTAFGAFNFGLSILGPVGHPFVDEGVECTGALLTGLCEGNDFVDLLGQGSVLGGAGLNAGVVDDGAFAHSDFDFQKAVPEPATLALLGVGLLGMGASLRRRVR